MIVITAITIWLSYKVLKTSVPLAIIPIARASTNHYEPIVLTLQVFQLIMMLTSIAILVIIYYVLQTSAILGLKKKEIKGINLSRQRGPRQQQQQSIPNRPIFRPQPFIRRQSLPTHWRRH